MKRISKIDYKYSKKYEPKQVELWKDLYRPSTEVYQLKAQFDKSLAKKLQS